MGSEQHIRNDRPGHEIGLLRLDARINIVADVAVRPAIEAAILDGSKIIGWQVIAEFIAFVNAHPHGARDRLDTQANGIPQSTGKDPRIFAVGIGHQHRRATLSLSRCRYSRKSRH